MIEYTEEQALASTWSLAVCRLSGTNNIIVIQHPKNPIIISEKSSRRFLKNNDYCFSYDELVCELIRNCEPIEANMVMKAANIILT